MGDLIHRIKIFLFRQESDGFRYLLLRPPHGAEALWGPLQSELGFGEKLEGAIRQHVRQDLGVWTPGQVIDLKQPSLWQIGDEEVVEWNYGYECVDPLDASLVEQQWAAHRWEGFPIAYPSMGLEFDRQAILRLHSNLSAA
jgi:hypothetical protein